MMFSNLGGAVFGRAGTLLAGGLFLASALGAATLWFGKDAAVRQRDHTDAWAQNACVAVGSFYQETDGRGRRLGRDRWGRACLDSIQRLAGQAAMAASNALAASQTHDAAQAVKRSVDRSAANRNNARRTTAKRQMENANAAVEADRVTGPWWSSYNRLLGVSDPADGTPDTGRAGGGGAEGDAVDGPPAVRPEAGGVQPDLGGEHASGSAVAVRPAGGAVPDQQRSPRPAGELVVARLLQ